MDYLILYFKELLHLTNEMSPYLLLGFLFAGILQVFFPKRILIRFMGHSNAKSSLNASLLGIPMPLCSCGVLPTGISLFRNGASRGSTNSFLISTPQTGVDSILVTYSMLGLPFALIRPLVALATGFIGGVLTNTLVKDKNLRAESAAAVADSDSKPTLKRMLQYAFVEFLQDISKWLVIGLLLAALISVALPDDFFAAYVGLGFVGMLVILLASMPLYVCATASVPLAAVLLMKGLSPGAVLVFLMAGPATNVASLTVLWKSLGKATTLVYLGTIIGGALLFGLLIDQLPAAWFQFASNHIGHEHGGLIPVWLSYTSSTVLFLLIINGFRLKYFSKNNLNATPMKNESVLLHVSGMTCNHCKANVENNLKKVAGVELVIADITADKVSVEGTDIDPAALGKVIEELGYNYKGLKES
jgi:hypothetical protein